MEWKLPKNMCCIGKEEQRKKLFVEEYVISFLLEMAGKESEPQMIVFYGDGCEREGSRYYFLQGAACHKASEETFGRMEEFYFRNIGKKYFPQLKGIGWYYTGGKSGEESILDILREIREQDFGQIGGYYVYYEKNPEMEEYMLSHKKRQEQEKEEQKKKEREREGGKDKTGKEKVSERKWPDAGDKMQQDLCGAKKKIKISPFQAVQILNMISLCILIICCIIAVTTINQYDKMKRLEETVIYLEASMEEAEPLEKQKNLPAE